jgi:hypothetical protein
MVWPGEVEVEIDQLRMPAALDRQLCWHVGSVGRASDSGREKGEKGKTNSTGLCFPPHYNAGA